MPLETSDLNQKAVLWTVSGVDSYSRPTLSVGIEIPVRWVHKKTESLDLKGRVVSSDATVIVDREIAIGSIVWKGELTNLPSPVSSVTDLYEVMDYRESPDIKGRYFRRTIILMRYGNTLPQIS